MKNFLNYPPLEYDAGTRTYVQSKNFTVQRKKHDVDVNRDYFGCLAPVITGGEKLIAEIVEEKADYLVTLSDDLSETRFPISPDGYDTARDRALAFVKEKYIQYIKNNFPEGFHILPGKLNAKGIPCGIGFYFGNKKVAEIKDNGCEYEIEISSYHTNSFFTDVLTEEEKAYFDNKTLFKIKKDQPTANIEGLEVLQAIVVKAYDPERRKQEEVEKVALTDAFLALPDLTGSEKQIAWAKDIRQKFIEHSSMDSIIEKNTKDLWKKKAKTAKFWIDARKSSVSEIFDLAFKK